MPDMYIIKLVNKITIKMHYQNTSDPKERKVRKSLAKDRKVWKSFITKYPTHATVESRCY